MDSHDSMPNSRRLGLLTICRRRFVKKSPTTSSATSGALSISPEWGFIHHLEKGKQSDKVSNYITQLYRDEQGISIFLRNDEQNGANRTNQEVFPSVFFHQGLRFAIFSLNWPLNTWVFPKIVGFPNNHLVFLLKMISTWGVKWEYHHLSGNIRLGGKTPPEKCCFNGVSMSRAR